MMKVGDLVKYSPTARDIRDEPRCSTWLKGIGIVTETRPGRPAQARVSFPNDGVHAWMFKETLEIISETR